MERSLDRYLRDNCLRADERFDVAMKEAEAEEPPSADDFLITALYYRVFDEHAREAAQQRLERCWQTVDRNSQPESAMFLALTLVGGERFTAVYFATDPPPGTEDSVSYLIIAPQAKVRHLRYRVDFLLTLSSIEPFEDARFPEGLAAHSDGHGRITKEMVVEVDGHEFHDRTKAQASRDRERDRALQSRELPVARFTGSDIWSDPFRCAEDALDMLHARVMSAGDLPRARW